MDDANRFAEYRWELNNQHKALRSALETGAESQAIEIFLALHGRLHASQIAPQSTWSYEDLLLDGLDEVSFRQILQGHEHSVAWIVWHLSRIEDITMNLLVAGRDQVFEAGNWCEKTCAPYSHTGNGSSLDDVADLSSALDLAALRAYRCAVGEATREIVSGLKREDFTRNVEKKHLQRVLDERAVFPESCDVVNYWGRKNVAGLLLMPPTRHTIVHWNEAHRRIISSLR